MRDLVMTLVCRTATEIRVLRYCLAGIIPYHQLRMRKHYIEKAEPLPKQRFYKKSVYRKKVIF